MEAAAALAAGTAGKDAAREASRSAAEAASRWETERAKLADRVLALEARCLGPVKQLFKALGLEAFVPKVIDCGVRPPPLFAW